MAEVAKGPSVYEDPTWVSQAQESPVTLLTPTTSVNESGFCPGSTSGARDAVPSTDTCFHFRGVQSNEGDKHPPSITNECINVD